MAKEAFAWTEEDAAGITVTMPDEDPAQADIQAEIDRIDRALSVTDALPGPEPLYVYRPLVNGDELLAWAKEQGFETTIPADDLHVTIAFSRDPVDWMEVGAPWDEELVIPAGGPRRLATLGEGAQVLLFASTSLDWRHKEIREAGASWDHSGYHPHVTISYGPMPEGATPYQGRLVLGPEVFEPLDPDWKAKIVET